MKMKKSQQKEMKMIGNAVNERLTLIVENNEQVLDFLHSGVTDAGLKITSLQAIKSDGHNLMVVDVEVSQAEGFEVVKCLGNLSQMPVILMNPVGTGGHLNLGAGEKIAPPFQPGELLTRITRLLNNRN